MVSFILPGNSATGGYEVANSCRFDSASSDYLNRSLGTPSNRKIFTCSAWVKRASTGTYPIFWFGADSNNWFMVKYESDSLRVESKNSGSTIIDVRTNALYRDFSAWYHVLVAVDTTQGTESNRIKIYVNGVQETSFQTSTYPSQDTDLNVITEAEIGNQHTTQYFDGYMAEVVFVDGTAQANTDLGEFDEDSPNIWKPISVSGLTFGTNGFYLDFKDSSSLGNDAAGSNNFTVNNIAAVNQHTDTCTNNFATFNGALGYNSTIVLAEGNIKGTTGSTHEALYGSIFSSIGVTQGKWYAEFKVTTNSDKSIIGISADLESDADGSSGSAFNFIYLGQGIGYYGNNGKIFHTNSNTQMTYGSSLSNNDIVGIALDVDNQEVYFSINGTFQNSGNPASGSSKTGGVVNEGARNIFSTGTGTIFFAVADFDRDATCAIEANFGGGSVSAISSGNSDANGYGNFEYSVPSGYYSLCTKNLAEYG